MKYIRLLRLKDQIFQILFVLISALYLHSFGWWTVYWLLGATFICIIAFLVNELIDRNDTDKYSWSNVHIRENEVFDYKIIAVMFIAISFLGLFFSFISGLFWWGLVMYIVGIMYSLKPFRLKNRFGLDILAQFVVWCAVPSLAPLALFHKLSGFISFMLIATFLIVFGVAGFPYQLADYRADEKAKLKGTHIILGMQNTLWLGFIMTFTGLFLVFIFKIHMIFPWIIPLYFILFYALSKYIQWLKMDSIDKQTQSIQNYIKTIRPFSYLLILYLFSWFLI